MGRNDCRCNTSLCNTIGDVFTMTNCDSKTTLREYKYGCTKRKGHGGYHKNGIVVW